MLLLVRKGCELAIVSRLVIVAPNKWAAALPGNRRLLCLLEPALVSDAYPTRLRVATESAGPPPVANRNRVFLWCFCFVPHEALWSLASP